MLFQAYDKTCCEKEQLAMFLDLIETIPFSQIMKIAWWDFAIEISFNQVYQLKSTLN